MDFFGIGTPELILVLIVLLIIVGPARLPEIASTIGRSVRKLKEATTELTNDFKEMADEVTDTGKEVDSNVNTAGELTEGIRDVAKEIEDVGKELKAALKNDVGLTGRLKKIATGSENVAKEADTAPKAVPEEEVSTQEEERGVEEQG